MSERSPGSLLALAALGLLSCSVVGLVVLGLAEVGEASGLSATNPESGSTAAFSAAGALVTGLLIGTLVGLVLAMLLTQRRAAGVLVGIATVSASVLAFALVSRAADGSTMGVHRAAVAERFSALARQDSNGRGSSDIVGTWAGSLAGEGTMEVRPNASGYEVSLNVYTPNGCTGSISGVGKLIGNVLKLNLKPDSDVDCTLTIAFNGNSAKVEEDGCMYFHGAACGFDGTLTKDGASTKSNVNLVRPAPAVVASIPKPRREVPAPAPSAPSAPRYTPPAPSPSPTEGSGFSPSTWSVGSRWIYDVQRRSTRSVIDEAAPLHIRSIWTIGSSSPTPDGKRVVLIDEGGDKKKTKTDVFLEQGCIRFGKSKDRSFCLADGRPTDVSIAGTRFDGVIVQTSKFEFTVVPEIGIVRIVGEADRHETETTVELIGYEVGGRRGGNTSLQPITCDWYISKRKLAKTRSIDSSDPLSSVAQRFLGTPTGRISVDLTDRHGANKADAATDDRMTVLRINGVAGPLGEGVQLRGKLRALKGYESLDGSTDYLMVATMVDREMIMHMLPIRSGRVYGDIHISTTVLDPKMDYSETFLTNEGPDTCKLQVVVGDHRDKSYLVADYLFDGDSLRRTSGRLSIQSHTWRDTSSLP